MQWYVGVFDWMALGVSGITTKSASVVKKKKKMPRSLLTVPFLGSFVSFDFK